MKTFMKSAIVMAVMMVGAANLTHAQCYSPGPPYRQAPNPLNPGNYQRPVEKKEPHANLPGIGWQRPADSRPSLHFPGNPNRPTPPVQF